MTEKEEQKHEPEESLPESEQTEVTIEAIGEQLLARLDDLDERLSSIERRLDEHGHDGYAPHDHKHEREPEPTGSGTDDKPPKREHFWARRIGE